MSEIIKKVWRSLCLQYSLEEEELLIDGNCTIHAGRDDVYSAVSQVMRWFLERSINRPEDTTGLMIKLNSLVGGGQVTFEDRSLRLPLGLRRRLFEPFALGGDHSDDQIKSYRLGLYLAKILVETRNNGAIEDRSDEMEGQELGHRLVMRLPAPSKDS